jgi:ribonuclease HII
MPWVVGIDEAGYGPNLGPLVQAAVALHLPDGDPAGWETLKPVVRRCGEKADKRFLIDDSKTVYTRGGLAALERTILVFAPISADVAELVRKTTSVAGLGEVATEHWFRGDEALPLVADREAWRADFEAFGELVAACGSRFHVRTEARIVPTSRFNRICDESGSKATVLSRGLVELLSEVTAGLRLATEPTLDAVSFLCDKQGGRNFYAGLLQEAFPDGWVVTERESTDESRYRVDLLPCPVTVTFRPRADGDSVAVALASMLCKYLREVCMRQFNRFWEKHVPGIRPTAGYPVDAKRFYAEIRPAMAGLGLTDDQVWRKR